MALTPEQRSQQARFAAHAQHAQGKTNTTAARAAFYERFEREVDPNGVLAPEERARRAEHARKAYYQKLAFKSSVARSKAKELLTVAEDTDNELRDAA